VTGSKRASRWIAAAPLIAVAAVVLGGCWTSRAEVWVRNHTDRAYALLLPVDTDAQDIAFVEIPPLSDGLAHHRNGPHLGSFVLFTADCRPIAGGAIKQQRTALVIHDGGVEIRPEARPLMPWPAIAYRDVPDCRARSG
jgi:hypothetical protein